jgi:tyrosyl-tRNA synthetase
LSPYEYWQFWRNTEDADVGRFLRLFTEMPLDEIAKLEALKDGEINEAKKILATEATALCHGRAAAEEAAKTARAVFEGGGAGDALPQVDLDRDTLATGVAAFELFVRAGLAASNGEARRLIKGGGARLNDAVIGSEVQKVTLADLDAAGAIKLSAGRKRHALVRPN